MLDGRKYLAQLMSMKLAASTCPHCSSQTHSVGKNSFCNFCEQYIDIVASGKTSDAFSNILGAMRAGKQGEALKYAESLLKGNMDPRQLYLLAQFYLDLAGMKYRQRDYNLHGFMEANAENIRNSLDFTMRWKECYFKAIKIVETELKNNLQIDPEILFIKFMSEAKLQKLVDAANTLRMLQTLDKRGILSEYALLVYSVEKNSKQAEASLGKALAGEEVNAFYYLAKYLAKQKNLKIAELMLQLLTRQTEIFLAQDLLGKVQTTIEASKM